MSTAPEVLAAPEDLLGELLGLLPSLRDRHAPTDPVHRWVKRVARREVEARFADPTPDAHAFGPFGPLRFPFQVMGAVTSLDLFDLDELILFAFYAANRGRWRRALDVGANLGLHTILLDRLGVAVRAYEPDPTHFALLRRNLALNGVRSAEPVNAAVSSRDGEAEFVRVLGNTTGSHLAGAKARPYGPLERFPVRVEAVGPLLRAADFVKLDAEGHEAEILCATTAEDWRGTEAVVEVGNAENAARLYAHLRGLGLNLFAQQRGWARVEQPSEMPASYRDGSLFVTAAPAMPWGEGA